MKYNFYSRLMTIGFFGTFCTLLFKWDDFLLISLFFISIIMFIVGFILSLIEVVIDSKNKKD